MKAFFTLTTIKRTTAVAVIATLLATNNSFINTTYAASTAAATSTTTATTTTATPYTLIDENDIATLDAHVSVYEHDKTGAKVMFVKNDDDNRAFNISFLTPAFVGKGTNHILEHITLTSSKKYPSDDLFFSMAGGTYNSYLNAFTRDMNTLYPVASPSEKQFKQLVDAYMSVALETDMQEYYFKKEGWRYELESPEAPLTVTGIVFNEMAAYMNMPFWYNSIKLNQNLYPDSVMSNDPFGTPEIIPNLTYEELSGYYDTFYHPSNAVILFYGNLDADEYLSYLDSEWLSRFDRRTDIPTAQLQKPFDEPRRVTVDFPAGKDAKTVNASIVSVTWAVVPEESRDLVAIQALADVLNNESGPLRERFLKAGLPGDYYVQVRDTFVQPYIMFALNNTSPAAAEQFERIVTEALAEVSKNGVDEGILGDQKIQRKNASFLTREKSNAGVNALSEMTTAELIRGDRYYYTNLNETYTTLTQDEIKATADKYFLNNNHRLTMTLTPKAGLLEENAAASVKRLAEKKAAMSADEITKLVADTKALRERLSAPQTERTAEALKRIAVLTKDDLPNEPDTHTITETKHNGATYLTTPIAGPVSKTTMYIDLSHLKPEELHYAHLFLSLVGDFATNKHTYAELDSMQRNYLVSMNGSITAMSEFGDSNVAYPVLSLNWISENTKAKQAAELIGEALSETVWDYDKMKRLIGNISNNLKNTDGLSIAAGRAVAAFSPVVALQNYIGSVEYAHFIQQTYKDVSVNPEAVARKLDAVKEKFLVKSNVTVTVAGEANLADIYPLVDNLPEQREKTTKYYTGFPMPKKTEAVVSDSDVNYVVYANPVSITDRGAVIAGYSTLENAYINPKVRFEGGAYGGFSIITETAAGAASYRDPNLAKTIDVFNRMGEAANSLTQADLDSSIMSVYIKYNAPVGKFSHSDVDFGYYMVGKGLSYQNTVNDKIKNVTVEDVKALFKDERPYSLVVSANQSAIKASGIEFEAVTPLIQKHELTRGEFLSILMNNPDAAQAAEAARSAGIAAGNEKGDLMLSKPLTKKEFATFVYKAMGEAVKASGAPAVVEIQPDMASILDGISEWARDAYRFCIQYGIIAFDDNAVTGNEPMYFEDIGSLK